MNYLEDNKLILRKPEGYIIVDLQENMLNELYKPNIKTDPEKIEQNAKNKERIQLIEYLNNLKQEDNCIIKGDSLISQAIAAKEDSISADFKEIFENKTELTVNKLSELFDYYLKLIFGDVKKEIMKYQEEKEQKEIEEQIEEKPKEVIRYLDEKIINQLNEYFKKKDIIIGKEELEKAIRIFITLVLFREKDKENKIKLNRKNLIDYLKSPDLWDIKVYKNENFNQNLNELKLIKIQINQTILLFNYLTGGKEIDEFKNIEENIKEENQSAAELPPIINPGNGEPPVENPEEEEEEEENENESEEEKERE